MIDKIDRKLITLLQQNARTPLKQLAGKVYLSSPATAARIEKLEKEGIISGYQANVDLKRAGFPIVAFVRVDLLPTQKPEFYPYICEHPHVLECYCVTGHYSQLLKVAFESTEALDSFINELQRFGSTETQIAFSNPKEPCGIGLEKIGEISDQSGSDLME